MANVNIEDELDDYLKIGGLLYSFISLKDLPDATFPGVLRELVVMDFPIIINAEVVLPDQTKAVKQYKSRLRKMTAAQKDIHGGFRLNVDAQVAEHQLIKVLQELISSSLKSCQLSLTIAVRTSRPARNRFEAEEAERILADRRQRVLHAIARMNGARGIPETLAQKRLFFSSLPGLGEINKRETDVLTLHAADLLPVEMPWKGTPNSPADAVRDSLSAAHTVLAVRFRSRRRQHVDHGQERRRKDFSCATQAVDDGACSATGLDSGARRLVRTAH